MLSIRKSITLSGESTFDYVTAAGYQAVIDSANPEDMNLSSWQADKAIYKANREQCRADQATFEDQAYALQDEMIAAQKKEE